MFWIGFAVGIGTSLVVIAAIVIGFMWMMSDIPQAQPWDDGPQG